MCEKCTYVKYVRYVVRTPLYAVTCTFSASPKAAEEAHARIDEIDSAATLHEYHHVA